ncbi:MAG: inositol monophosphatase [Jiangellaceae bacterium]
MPSVNEYERFEFAQNLIIEAGDLALQYFASVNELSIMSKGAQDMVSEADIAVEKLIRSRLMAEYPDDGYLGEETGHEAASGDSGIWVVDPIDGTQPFLSGLSTWCISIAYVRSNEVLLGMVNNPAAGELFIGGVGRTAELNGQPIAPRQDASVGDGLTYLGCNPRLRPEQVVPVLDRLLRAGGMFVRNGSGALGLCDVACGRLIGYVEAHINSWDCLGGIAVCRSAGVRVSDYLTADSIFVGGPLVAGLPQVFDQLVVVLGDPSAPPTVEVPTPATP